MGIWVGIDIAKHLHWATAIDDVGQVLLDQRVPNDPAAIQGLIDGLAGLGGEPVIGLDVVGGIAALAQAMLQAAGFRLVHVSGLAVNRARQGTTGGEHKSDPRDARVIAELVRTRRDLRPIEPVRELDLELRLLVGRRGDLQVEQTRRLARLHDLLVGIHPGLERVLDLTTKGGLWLASRYVTPAEIREVGREGVMAHLQAAGGLSGRQIQTLADRALAAAAAQQLAVPAERLAARLVRELAAEALACRQRLIELDAELDRLLERHPDAALIRSLPGMGAVLTAEFIAEAGTLARYRSADALAAAAGLAPVLRQSGKVRFQRRPSGGNKALKRVFYQSAFCSLSSPDSRVFYARKRREGKRHHQALIALARRRIDVLWAMLHTRQPFQPNYPKAA
ncbi:MAG TPA: IS110 family transposase [Actinomycetes bacterium]|nr:IS110 family transposase [Actinomycetes bacterium]